MKRAGSGRIFVTPSGRMPETTAAHDLAVRMLGDEKQAIFFVGYAAPETPGGRLKNAKPGERFLFSGTGGEVVRKCESQDFDLPAPATRDGLVRFASQVN